MRHLPLLCLSAVVSTVRIPSQSTLSVGPGGFAQIRDALAAAQPGDTLLVQPGTYAHFEATIGVTIRAALPGTARIAYDPNYTPAACQTSFACMQTEGPTYLAPPTGQELHLIGLTFLPTASSIGFASLYHRVVVSSGTVTMDGCVIRSAAYETLRITSATVSLQDCQVINESAIGLFAPGISANSSTITAIGCQVRGGPAVPTNYAASEAVKLVDATLHGSGLDLRGGSSILQAGGPAVRAIDSTVWLSDSHLEAGNSVCAFDGLDTTSQLARCTVVANSSGCTQLAVAPLLGVHRPHGLTLGSVFSLDFRTEPNGFVFLSASSALDALPLLETVQPLSLDPGTLVFVGLHFADATGLASGAWTVPNNPALVGATLWFQGAAGLSLPLQMTPVAGGVIR